MSTFPLSVPNGSSVLPFEADCLTGSSPSCSEKQCKDQQLGCSVKANGRVRTRMLGGTVRDIRETMKDKASKQTKEMC